MESIKSPHGWDDDPLAKFLDASWQNTFFTYEHYPQYYTLLKDIHLTFQHIPLDYMKEWIFPFFASRANSAFLGSVRLAISHQTTDAYALSRACLENALTALYLHKKPEVKDIWFRRQESAESRKQSRREFSNPHLFDCLQQESARLYSKVHPLYEFCIDMGAHPNIWGTASTLEIREEEREMAINFLTDNPPVQKLCFEATATTGVYALEILRRCAQERFDIAGITEEIHQLHERTAVCPHLTRFLN